MEGLLYNSGFISKNKQYILLLYNVDLLNTRGFMGSLIFERKNNFSAVRLNFFLNFFY